MNVDPETGPRRPPNEWLAAAARWILVASQTTTLALTWPLWLDRDDIPLVQRWDLPDGDAGPWVALSLALILLPDLLALLRRRPPAWILPAAVTSHALCLALAMMQDELRVQPQMIVPALLLFATLRGPGPRLFGLGVLASMWGWAGLHKILSDRYVDVFGPTVVRPLADGVSLSLSDSAMAAICHTVSWAELAMGICLIFVPFIRWRLLRWTLVLSGLGLHLGIFVSLWSISHNETVWPWNVSAGLTSAWMLATTRQTFLHLVLSSGWTARLCCAALLLLPTGYYTNATHPYCAFVLYTGNTPSAQVETLWGKQSRLRYIESFRSYIPPTHRNYRTIFLHRSKPGEQLVITDPRAWAKRNDTERVVVRHGDEIDP